MANVAWKLNQLQQERSRLAAQLERLTNALSALGTSTDRSRATRSLGKGQGQGRFFRKADRTPVIASWSQKDHRCDKGAMGQVETGSKSRIDFGVELHFANAKR